jgi:hypothetical protein
MKRATNLGAAAAVVGALTIAAAARALMEGPETIDVTEHHLRHAVLILGGVATALLLARARRRSASASGRAAWLAPALLAPLAAMALMVPTFYGYLGLHPTAHALTHLGLVVAGFLTAWCGERYREGMGWATSIFLEVMAVAAAFGWGVSSPGAS